MGGDKHGGRIVLIGHAGLAQALQQLRRTPLDRVQLAAQAKPENIVIREPEPSLYAHGGLSARNERRLAKKHAKKKGT